MEAEIGWMNLKQGKPRTDCNSSVAGWEQCEHPERSNLMTLWFQISPLMYRVNF
jgi:hypothetical protein